MPDSFAWKAHHAFRYARGYWPLASSVRSEPGRLVAGTAHAGNRHGGVWRDPLDNRVDCGRLSAFLRAQVKPDRIPLV